MDVDSIMRLVPKWSSTVQDWDSLVKMLLRKMFAETSNVEKEKGADPYDLKQQENVLAESRMMLPDCQKRLEVSLIDLQGMLAELEQSGQEGDDCRKRLEAALIDLQGMLAELEQSGQEGDEICEAKTVVKDVEALFETPTS